MFRLVLGYGGTTCRPKADFRGRLGIQPKEIIDPSFRRKPESRILIAWLFSDFLDPGVCRGDEPWIFLESGGPQVAPPPMAEGLPLMPIMACVSISVF